MGKLVPVGILTKKLLLQRTVGEVSRGSSLLYHTEYKTLSTRKQAYKKEAEKEFFGRIYVPDDLEHILLSQ